MKFARPVIAQYYRRGKSFGCRDFSASRSQPKDDVGPAGPFVAGTIRNCVGLAVGYGIAYFLTRCTTTAEEMEEFWLQKQQYLDVMEEKLKRDRIFFGVTSAKRT